MTKLENRLYEHLYQLAVKQTNPQTIGRGWVYITLHHRMRAIVVKTRVTVNGCQLRIGFSAQEDHPMLKAWIVI